MNSRNLTRALLCTALLSAVPTVGHAQAFCALRDPTVQIYQLYPQVDSYRSIVRLVNDSTRSEVAKRLGFSIHSRELGEHTLYVAMTKDAPIGIVHVRSEPSAWGLMEIAWSIGLDMKLRGFAFQRCRGRGCQDVDTPQFRQILIGRDVSSLRKLLSDDGHTLQVQYPWASPEGERMGLALVRSALKTLAVTDAAWGEELAALR